MTFLNVAVSQCEERWYFRCRNLAILKRSHFTFHVSFLPVGSNIFTSHQDGHPEHNGNIKASDDGK